MGGISYNALSSSVTEVRPRAFTGAAAVASVASVASVDMGFGPMGMN